MKMKPTLIMQVSCTMGDWSVLKKQKHSEQGDPRGQGSIKEEVVLQPVKARGRGTGRRESSREDGGGASGWGMG